MTRARSTLAVLAAVAANVAVAVVRWRAATPVEPARREIALGRASVAGAPSDSALDAAEDATVADDPFRLANEPAAVRYDPSSEGSPGPTAMTPAPRPVLALKAIIGGPPWQAVIDGIPGQPAGAVVGPGSRFDKLVVRSVARDSVVVQGADTTWVLTFKGRM